ncbi:Ig-like domain-containing protein [Acinetobacter sp. NIPH 2699]|uniref:Ig-like domain-containing protein n=1 Tax=Acinetobacter sp. NIPH 2699 TaxID=2923433 RepID=UPI001F4A673E|nr:Ig-like domain-containing protein [Acinetobacter sp. NIPH 2699]MCH7337570.1 Ig-like domain-containing protein [Acinetobacter sp. NIPH 2699]
MNKKQLTLRLSAITISILLASCGGGGSKGYYNNDSGSNPGNGNGGGSVETPLSEVNISVLQLLNTNGDPTQVITVNGAIAKVRVTNAKGEGISGALVTFSGDGITFGTSNASVLTNADGEASIAVQPTDANATGAYQISAIANYQDGIASTAPYNFQLQAANIDLVGMVLTTSSLESGASTNVTLKTQDKDTSVNQNNVTVNFTASCGTFEPATVVSSNQGDVTTSYTAIGTNGRLCEDAHTITATIGNTGVTRTLPVTIAAVKPNSIVYTSGDVTLLGIESSGSASSGQIEFTLYANGVVAADKEVNIELIDAPEDLSFVSLGNRDKKTVKSNSSGKVFVNLYPGNKPGPVEIRATLASDTNITALSKGVAVATGRVTQSGLSLSVSKNSLQNRIDGDEATITARMVDRNGNPVPNGTVISFVTEGGSITPNCASSNGSCSVTLTTQDPRPLDNRVTVLAYVEGDKSYIDKNGNNVYDEGIDELVSNIGDFFLDKNENNTYDANDGEYIYRRNAGTAACAASTFKQPNIAGTCNTKLGATLREQLVFAFAENTPTFTNEKASGNLLSFNMYGNSQLSVPMPSGTTISVTAEDNTENSKSCSAELMTGSSPVASVFNFLTSSTFRGNSQTYYGYRLKDCFVGDEFKISVSAPDGKVSTIFVDYQ